MRNIKLFLLLSLLIGSNGQLNAQVFVRAFNYRPTGDFGFYMKPTFSAEIGRSEIFADEDQKFRFNVSASLMLFRPRLNEFPSWVTDHNSTGSAVISPTNESYKNFAMIQANGGLDYAIIQREPFTFFVGLDVVLGMIYMKWSYSDLENNLPIEDSGQRVTAGLRGRIGVEYQWSQYLSFVLSCNRQGFIVTDPYARYGANDYGVGMIIMLN